MDQKLTDRLTEAAATWTTLALRQLNAISSVMTRTSRLRYDKSPPAITLIGGTAAVWSLAALAAAAIPVIGFVDGGRRPRAARALRRRSARASTNQLNATARIRGDFTFARWRPDCVAGHIGLDLPNPSGTRSV